MTPVFKTNELFAIYKVASMMANADGVIFPDEERFIADEMEVLGVNSSPKKKTLEKKGQALKPLDALNVIAGFTEDQKKHINAFFGRLISIDGDIADAELALWRLVGELCELPKMSVRQAINLSSNS